jgi:C4-dicarboxylate-binding protein DctP
MFSSKFFEVQDYLTETNHGYLGYLVMVNPGFWNSLPDDVRNELDAIVLEVASWANEQSVRINQEGKDKIIASGDSEIVSLTPDQLAEWQTAMRPVWQQFEGNIGTELIEAAQSARQ